MNGADLNMNSSPVPSKPSADGCAVGPGGRRSSVGSMLRASYSDGRPTLRAPVRPKPARLRSKASLGDHEESSLECVESSVLVLYAGGTIGMYKENDVYEVRPGYLCQLVRSMPMLNDEKYSSQLDQTPGMSDRPFALPISQEGRRVIYDIHEYQVLKDSSNLNIDDWVEMAEDIERHYKSYDGFVILHGTDTMAYTSSALSFMLENLGKPVILTGAQVPLPELRSDGRDNLLGAIYIAGHYVIPEVTLYFNDQLFRGNRVIKESSESFHCFNSPNFPPLIKMAVHIEVAWESIFRPNSLDSFKVHKEMESQVGVLRLFPGITKETVQAFLSPLIKGVVLQTFGAGNGPDDREDLMKVLRSATERGVLIINCTQCARGMVTAAYRTGKSLQDAGIVPGCDITPEAALTKLCYVLGKKGLTQAQRMNELSNNLRGEIKSAGRHKHSLSLQDSEFIRAVVDTLMLTTSQEVKAVQDALFSPLMCAAAKNGDLESLKHFLNCGGDLRLADYDDRTPLHLAAGSKNVEVVQFLLENGCSIYARDSFGNSPFFESIRSKNVEIIKLIKKTGGHLSHTCPNELGTMMCHAAALNDWETLEVFHIAGIDVNSTDYCGNTALHVAVMKNSKECVKFLIDAGADTTLKDGHDDTPENIADRLGLEEISQLVKGLKI